MAISVEDLFSHSFVLSLSEYATDVFHCRFARYFKDSAKLIRPFTGYQIEGLNPRTNILIGHTAIVRMAKALNWPFVCIFESDAFPRIDAQQRLSALLQDNALPEDTRVLWLGWCSMRGGWMDVRGNDMLTRPRTNCAGAQAWVIFQRGYDFFLAQHSASNVHVDVGFGSPPGVYVVRESIFCQADMAPSAHGHNGYSGGGRWSMESPPDGFEHDALCDSIVLASRAIANGKGAFTKSNLAQISEWFHDFPAKSPRCLIIGSNQSILTCNYREKVDRFDGDVIRINNMPDQRYVANYGGRMDWLVASRWYRENIKCDNVPTSILYLLETNIIDNASRLLNITSKRLTDGMMAIVIAMAKYQEVNVFGFGNADVKESGQYHSIHNSRNTNMSSSEWLHDINAEHCFIRKMATTPVDFAGRIVSW